MAIRGRIDFRLATQVLVLQLVVVTLTLAVALGLSAVLNRERLDDAYGIRALDIARVVAAAPAVRSGVAQYDVAPQSELTPDALAAGPLQGLATLMAQRVDVLFVVITNAEGIRLAHPDRQELGREVSTNPAEALAGHEEVLRQYGVLGSSVRAKVPILAPDSDRVVGEVSVGISTKAVHEDLLADLRKSAAVGALALLVGFGGSLALARRWRGLTLGLRPTELVGLVRTQAAVLHGIGAGVLAVDTEWNTAFVNDDACRLLGIGDETGRPVDDIGLTPRVLRVFKAADATPTLATVGERIVVVAGRSVSRDGRALGTVLVVRDRTDVEALTRQLDAVQVMSKALRAQRHEFANRMHLLNGLLHSGHVEEGQQYLEEILGSGPLGSDLPGLDSITDAHLQALLSAKAAYARESGVELTIGDNTWVSGRLDRAADVTTVVGNLIDNAIDAARSGANTDRVVEVELLQDGSTLHVTVADSGDGVRPDFVEQLFTEGTTTKPDSGIPGGRGIGLALSRQISRAHGGDLKLASPGNPDAGLSGAEFIARLPGVMTEEARWAIED